MRPHLLWSFVAVFVFYFVWSSIIAAGLTSLFMAVSGYQVQSHHVRLLLGLGVLGGSAAVAAYVWILKLR